MQTVDPSADGLSSATIFATVELPSVGEGHIVSPHLGDTLSTFGTPIHNFAMGAPRDFKFGIYFDRSKSHPVNKGTWSGSRDPF